MTHFFVLAILPKDVDRAQIEAWLEASMRPYNEQTPRKERRKTFHDYFVIGGRYDGVVKGNRRYTDLDGKPSDAQHGFNFSKQHETIENNLAPLSEATYPLSWGIPKHILDPQGRYLHQRDMGWWGTHTDRVDMTKWFKRWTRLIEKYKDNLVVGLDCHV